VATLRGDKAMGPKLARLNEIRASLGRPPLPYWGGRSHLNEIRVGLGTPGAVDGDRAGVVIVEPPTTGTGA
jgi:hypothetical protein